MKIYPPNWEEPEEPTPVVLTEQQRLNIKTKMQDFVIAQGKPVLIKDLIDEGQSRIAISWPNKHISDDDLKDIALEIRDEWGYPGQEE